MTRERPGTTPDAKNHEVAREVMHRAIRRLGVLEVLIFAGAALAACVGGLLAAFLAGSAFGLPFGATWAIASVLLLVLPGLFVWGRDMRWPGRARERAGKSGNHDQSNPKQDI